MYFFLKRVIDVTISFFLIIFLFPLLIFSSLLILIIDRQQPLFIQKRSGINGRKFNLYKLQTMRNVNGKKKITSLGKVLRVSKIDELPQLYNILKNSMSIIGPRPLYVEFNQFYKKQHLLRLSVKPGLTGLAQIKLRKNTDWSRKFNFDVIYVKKANLKLDIYIIFQTFLLVFKSIFLTKKRSIENYDYYNNFFQNYK